MLFFSQIENNIVVQVHVLDPINSMDGNKNHDENIGISFLKNIHGIDKNFKQTCIDGTIRKNYAGIGYLYNERLDAFIAPQPADPLPERIEIPGKWVLNEEKAKYEFSGKLKI